MRLHGAPALRSVLAADGGLGRLAAAVLGPQCRPVRAVLFNKTASTNWAHGWHQDRTICVRERRAVEGFGPWTTKAGLLHVAPPFAIVEHMLTMRVHLDPVPADNAPLLIAPGSHRLGLVPVEAVADVVARFGQRTCLAARGDVWLYATPILHTSAAAKAEVGQRRVLQVDFRHADAAGRAQVA